MLRVFLPIIDVLMISFCFAQYPRQSAAYIAQDIFMESDQIKCEQSKFYTVQFSYLYTIVGRIPWKYLECDRQQLFVCYVLDDGLLYVVTEWLIWIWQTWL